MQKSKDLSGYFRKDKSESKPENDSKPWSKSDTKLLLEMATEELEKYGIPNIIYLAKYFKRSENAITVQLSKNGWFKDNNIGYASHKNIKGTVKSNVLEYVKEHPNVFCSDVNKALNVKASSALSRLTAEKQLKRIKHKGNGNYLYSYNEIPVTIEKVEAKPGGTAKGTRRIINLDFFDGIGKIISNLFRW